VQPAMAVATEPAVAALPAKAVAFCLAVARFPVIVAPSDVALGVWIALNSVSILGRLLVFVAGRVLMKKAFVTNAAVACVAPNLSKLAFFQQ